MIDLELCFCPNTACSDHSLWTRKRKSGWEYDWIPLVPALALRLKAWKLKAGLGEYVFMNPEKTDRLRSFRYFMPNLTKRARVRHFGVHAIRHLTASLLSERNAPLIDIKTILRHRKITTTERYIHQLSSCRASLAFLPESPPESPRTKKNG